MQRELSFYFDTVLNFSGSVTEHNFLLRCIPADTPEQKVLSYTLTVFPDGAAALGKDSFGNVVRAGRVQDAHDSFRYTLQGMAYRDDSLRVPAEAEPFYRYPSPLTQVTPELGEFFAGIISACGGPEASGGVSVLEKARFLCKAVHDHFVYTPGETNIMTTAGEAFASGRGVCQDYAHVLITLCRLAGIPARYVSGLFIGEGASHAWTEIWMDGLWYGVDPTHDRLTDETYLKLCIGRDYADCPIERGVFSGWAEQTQKVFTKVTD